MLRAFPFVIEFALLVYALIDCIQSEEGRIRNLPKIGWILLILIVPVVGPVAWLVAGRPAGSSRPRLAWPSTQTAGFPKHERPRRQVAPDDDPAFLSALGQRDPEHEELLRKWEAQLREREQRLSDGAAGSDPSETTPSTSPSTDDDD